MKTIKEIVEQRKNKEKRMTDLKHGLPMTNEEIKNWEKCFSDIENCFENQEEVK